LIHQLQTLQQQYEAALARHTARQKRRLARTEQPNVSDRVWLSELADVRFLLTIALLIWVGMGMDLNYLFGGINVWVSLLCAYSTLILHPFVLSLCSVLYFSLCFCFAVSSSM
jgi:hypothetical protein